MPTERDDHHAESSWHRTSRSCPTATPRYSPRWPSAGRDPDQLTYGYSVSVTVREGARSSRGQVPVSAEQVAEQLVGFVRGGFSFLNLSTTGDRAEQRERLARVVLPAVRNAAPARR